MDFGEERSEFQPLLCHLFFFFFNGCANDMQKFPDQKSNPCHSSDDARSLTDRPPGNSSALPSCLHNLEPAA